MIVQVLWQYLKGGKVNAFVSPLPGAKGIIKFSGRSKRECLNKLKNYVPGDKGDL